MHTRCDSYDVLCFDHQFVDIGERGVERAVVLLRVGFDARHNAGNAGAFRTELDLRSGRRGNDCFLQLRNTRW